MSAMEEECFMIEDDSFNYKSISCENLPELLTDKLVAKKHFSRFGRICKFILRPKRRSCIIDFTREDEAKAALLNAGIFNGQSFDIKYSLTDNPIKSSIEYMDPDIQSELNAMANSTHSGPARKLFSNDAMGSTEAASSNVSSFNLKLGQPKMLKPILKLRLTAPENSGTVHPKIDVNLKNELESILQKQANTPEEQYKVLDARDKLIRLTTVRTIDINKVERTIGTCPDMCPEKERLLRETRNQVASFEVDSTNGSGMDYRIAIKEYSRSSADQETPLAHELRPEPVLKMTMDYLMGYIMDLCDDEDINIGDWFHFVWDRTRSIRKDITQQELCSLGGVQLLEQCARFHIHCAARLIAEDPSVFDQRINTENLTKCLQTLKYMYHDLRLKNIKCPKEPEFRGYIILLNLHDSNFLWEIKQLPETIQKSVEVQSAVSFYLAMESNNYVKFFRLIKKTTYMNACILLRYFSQVRYKALQTIVKAYNWPRQSVSLTLNYLLAILAFESEEEGNAFFNHYGLESHADKVILDRNSFYLPDEPFVPERALEVVEAKRHVSVGESICGEPLNEMTTFENHQPHCSFDEYGFLLPVAWTAQDQIFSTNNHTKSVSPTNRNINKNTFKMPALSTSISPKQQFNAALTTGSLIDVDFADNRKQILASDSVPNIFNTTNQTTPFPDLSLFANEQGADKLDSIFQERTEQPAFVAPEKQNNFSSNNNSFCVSDDYKMSNSYNYFDSIFSKKSTASDSTFRSAYKDQETFESLTDSSKYDATLHVPKKLTFEIETNEDCYADKQLQLNIQREKEIQERNRKIERERAEKIKKCEESRQRISKLSHEIYEIMSRDIQFEEIKNIVEGQLKVYYKIMKSSDILLKNLLHELEAEMVVKIFEEESRAYTRTKHILSKYFSIWQTRVAKNREHLQFIRETPAWTPANSLEENAAEVEQSAKELNIQLMERYRLGIPKVLDLSGLEDIEPVINIIDLIEKELENLEDEQQRPQLLLSRKHFKIVLSFPLMNEDSSNYISYFNSYFDSHITVSRLETMGLSQGVVCETHDKFSVCLRKISEKKLISHRNEVTLAEAADATGLLFLMIESEDYSLAKERLHRILNLPTIKRDIPVVLMIYVSQYKKDLGELVEQMLEIDELKNNGNMLCCITLQADGNSFLSCIEYGFKYIVSNSAHFARDYELEMQNFVSFLQGNLVGDIWQKFNSSFLRNPTFQLFCQKPQNVVNLYNEAINQLISMVNEDYEDCPGYPIELKEFVPKTTLDIPLSVEYFPGDWKDFMRNMKIIEFFEKLKLQDVPVFSNNIEKLETELLNYAKQCIPFCENSYRRGAFTSIKVLLEKLQKTVPYAIEKSQEFTNIFWLDIMPPIALELLKYVWNAERRDLPTEIIYRISTHKQFSVSTWWLESESIKQIKFQSNNNSVILPARNDDNFIENDPNKINDSCDDLEDLYLKGISLTEKCHKNIEKLNYNLMMSTRATRNLDETIHRNQIKNRKKRIASDENKPRASDEQENVKKVKIDCTLTENNSSTLTENDSNTLTENDSNAAKEDDSNNMEEIMAKAQRIIKRVERRLDERKRCEDVFKKFDAN